MNAPDGNHVAGEPADDVDEIDEALAEYLRAADAGQCPDPQSLFDRYPGLGPELERFLADNSHLCDLARQFGYPAARADRDPDGDADATLSAPGGPGPDAKAASADDLPAAHFGEYKLLGEIARGGMGVVF